MVLNKLKYGKPTTSLKGKNIVAPSLIFVTRACHWGAVTNPDRDREGALVRLLLFIPFSCTKLLPHRVFHVAGWISTPCHVNLRIFDGSLPPLHQSSHFQRG